ncbi:MAG: DUF1028 domain-containing protein [candidate division Zixibacteria bacterium]
MINGAQKIKTTVIYILCALFLAIIFNGLILAEESRNAIELPQSVSTFSIVACDPATGEIGVAVASKFFAVGSVVPWAKANIGAVATQSYANTSFGYKGLELLGLGFTPNQTMEILLKDDDNPTQRQVGIVSPDGKSATYTGENCLFWAGGRNGLNYAVQGNILTGEDVVLDMEKAFLETAGTLASRMYAALVAGNEAGGDSRGKQSAAMYIAKEGAGYGGYIDNAIDIRVDDHPEPFKELGRLLQMAEMNYDWNVAWTAFSEKRFDDALPPMERAAKYDPAYAEVFYDLAVIRLAAGDTEGALKALKTALEQNPKLKKQMVVDGDLDALRDNLDFKNLIAP